MTIEQIPYEAPPAALVERIRWEIARMLRRRNALDARLSRLKERTGNAAPTASDHATSKRGVEES